MTARLLAATVGAPVASASARAAATPTRTPVKLPGPIVTAIRSSSQKGRPASPMSFKITGMSRSAWPRSRTSWASRSSQTPSALRHRTAAERAPSEVSKAKIFMPGILEDLRRLLEGEAGPARAQRGRIAVSHIAQEIRSNSGAGEKLLVHARVVEARHGSCVEAERAGGHYEIRALQRAVARAVDGRRVWFVGEPRQWTLTLGRVRIKLQIVADDGGRRRLHGLVAIAFAQVRQQTLLCGLRLHPDKARRQAVVGGWA